MTKTFENGPHVAVGVSSQSSSSPSGTAASVEAHAGTASKPPPEKHAHPLRTKAVYNAVCTTSTSSSGSAALMSTNESHMNANTNTNSLAEEDSVTNLDELKLRALLDEAITYKTPKDREGKSKLFNTLLIDAEDDLRKEHAHNASGPARHFSSTAKKRHRHRRQPSSVSENLTHGGSLNDLAKQELYEYESAKAPRPKTVSTRQREGGSLPCNVNAGAPHVDKAYFMEERARQQEQRSMRTSTVGDFGHVHSAFGVDYHGAASSLGGAEPASTFISQASIPITAKVDEGLSFAQLAGPGVGQAATHNPDGSQRTTILKKVASTQHCGPLPYRKLDENDNALTQSATGGLADVGGNLTSSSAATASAKRKSKQKKSLENVITAKDIKGHRSDIIENIDKLVSYIEGTEDKTKKKLHKQHSHTLANEDKSKSKRTRKKSATMLARSNSMEEMSTTKLEDFSCRFEALDVKEKAPLRPTKSNAERPSRLPKGWGVSSEQLQMPAGSTSAENVEVADFIYVTKKKKSKKRRNSLDSRGNPSHSTRHARPAEFHSLRASSPRRKSASSAPHSDKSGDSSDNESVHSLPLDGENKSQQISYADIARNSERPKWNRLPSERRKVEKQLPAVAIEEKPLEIPLHTVTVLAPAVVPAVSSQVATSCTPIPNTNVTTNAHQNASAHSNATCVSSPMPTAQECNRDVAKSLPKEKETDTDLSSLQNWPEIRNNKVNQAKTNNMNSSALASDAVQQQQPTQDWPSIISNGGKTVPTTKHPAGNGQQLHAKQHVDNKQKKGGGKAHQTQHTPPSNANEHFQPALQVQQVQVSNRPYDGGVYVYGQDHEQHEEMMNNPQQVIQQVSEQSQLHLYQMPPNIRDVQSIEEMQMRSLQAVQMSPALVEEDDVSPPPLHVVMPQPPSSGEKYRPAVVILSSDGDRHATSDITFGFGINEQLLSGDVCADFVSRFLQPDVAAQIGAHVDQLVDYVGSDWEDILMQTHTGKVKYYTDELS